MDLRRISTLLVFTAQCAAFTMLAGLAQAQSSLVDRIAMVVNGQPITQLDLKRREQFYVQQLRASQQAIPEPAAMAEQIKNRAIIEAVLVGLAKRQNMYPTATMLDEAIKNNAQQANVAPEAFFQRLAQSGVSESEYRNDLAEQMAIARVRERELGNKIKVTDADIDRFLAEPASGLRQENQVYVLALVKPEGNSADAAQQAQQLRASALGASGEAFKALQNTVTNAPAKHQVDLGFVADLDKLPSVFAQALQSLNPGQISPVIETSGGYFIVRLNDRRSLNPTVTQTRASHILLLASPTEDSERTRAEIARLRNILTIEPTRFETLAKQFSQDGSASKGGDLGWMLPGDTVPEFERMMDLLAPAEISQPVQSPFGWHIIRVDERVNREIPAERLRNQARQAALNRKQEAALNTWYEALKKNAYIEYR